MSFRAAIICTLLLPVTALRKRLEANAAMTDMHRLLSMTVNSPSCQEDHMADMPKPMEQVIRENPDADMNCYFEKAGYMYSAIPGNDKGLRFWVHPVTETPDYKMIATNGAEGMKADPVTCKGGWKGDGTGPLKTFHYEGGTVNSHIDCGYYSYDDLYFFTLGWLRGQGRIDGRLLSNATAWEEQAAKECAKMKEEIQPKPEETSLLYNAQQNKVIASRSSCSLKPDCKNPVTPREFKLHVYTKCLMGGKRTFANEMAYGYGRACLLKEKNMIGHGVECQHLPE